MKFLRYFAEQKKEKKKKSTIIPLAAVALSMALVLTAVISIATSGTKAKYTTKQVVTETPVTVIINADLAENLEVKEHVAERQASGEYVLGSDFTTANTYHLMPGVDIPKDPKVYVTGKTEIPAYLYIEIVDTNSLFEGADPVFGYTLASGWSALDVTGRNGGKVYVYSQTLQKTAANAWDQPIPIFPENNEKVTVRWDLDRTADYSAAQLKFYTYMAQAADGKTAEQIFSSQLATP